MNRHPYAWVAFLLALAIIMFLALGSGLSDATTTLERTP